MNTKNVCVLCATYNGAHYLNDQLNSIFNQSNVKFDIYISDDCSVDDTLRIVNEYIKTNPNIYLLPRVGKFGSAALNFYRLFRDAPIENYDYVALSDQDDIWLPNKLERAIDLIKLNSADAYSSNVTAFWPSGEKRLLIKSNPQREYDYLFEPAGPGCTYVITVDAAINIKNILNDANGAIRFPKHDWLFYAITRSKNKKWIIDSFSSIMYRQHSDNEVGANVGAKAKLKRISILRSGEYLANVKKLCLIIAFDQQILFSNNPFLTRYRFLRCVFKCRRNSLEGFFLVLMILLGIAKVPD